MQELNIARWHIIFCTTIFYIVLYFAVTVAIVLLLHFFKSEPRNVDLPEEEVRGNVGHGC